jgi:uncharacterized protein YacL
MSRVLLEAESKRRPNAAAHRRGSPEAETGKGPGSPWSSWLTRTGMAVGLSALAAVLRPFGLHILTAGAAGLLLGITVFLAELLLQRAEPSCVIGGTLGLLAGLLAGFLITGFVESTSLPSSTKSFFVYAAWVGVAYLGLVAGTSKGGQFLRGTNLQSTASAKESQIMGSAEKLLDTSVLIDGRIADICETHFLDGPLLVPQFVLRELQSVADSPDTLRRQRGRRGLEVLQRIQKMAHLQVQVLDEDLPPNSEVDQQLIELARRSGAKIVTNDYNLNKVAKVQGINVLNVNELANALRPAVLPGEAMRVFILREGKEANQGVAFLEDGTMVVVDGARRLINKTVDILVTSVHQTPAGKMIFGRMDERGEPGGSVSRQAAAGADRGHRGNLPGGQEN